MKIVFFEIEGWEKRYLKKRLKEYSLEFYKNPCSQDRAKIYFVY